MTLLLRYAVAGCYIQFYTTKTHTIVKKRSLVWLIFIVKIFPIYIYFFIIISQILKLDAFHQILPGNHFDCNGPVSVIWDEKLPEAKVNIGCNEKREKVKNKNAQ